MKKVFLIFLSLIVLAVFVGTGVFLFNKSREKPEVFEVVSPYVTDIVKKTVATGKVIPRKEVNVTSQVSGVVDQLFVIAGDTVEKGDVIARISLAPNMIALNNAESQLESARISLANAEQELERQKNLMQEKLISASEYNRFQLDYELKRERVNSAENNLLLIKEGATKKSDLVSNVIRATSDGMILDVPNKEGAFIVESSTFGSGTTVATLADMNDMIFEGMVDEAEVGKIREGMELLLDVGALEGEPFSAVLEYISPKGVQDQGTIKFQIRAAVDLREQLFLRANYSANADIVLDKREAVIAINEGNLIIENDKHYVEVQTGPQQFERREVTTGLSDGIQIEIVSGLKESDKIKEL
ncbi:efflux RND transporter periplasmic adaptor subunit [Gilvimarinus algae]|uniref:Efflux RND transporter periplasmic adaptor subunit n=1 Tax=Gilvimarinus algae TaxID=3058037 RepID=A0ABT8TBR8_9GAMM|nr:efflux RND transporter periplasmic adaptor subunit [Gilvimarinus sp. SDUM040014]MDO3381396.1 efflux RND transporter periplasmic adaptor subunit [Gilvimarinus sp. SDUM040014]